METNNKIKIDVEVNKDELEETADTLERIGDAMPNIVIRNNQNVYLTINNFSENCKCEEENEEDMEEI